MSEKYKTDADGLYFATFSVVGWLDVFTRREYQEILIESIKYCQENKNLQIFCYCLMTNHVHLMALSENGELSNILRDLKSFTAKKLITAIAENPRESRKELFLNQFEYYGKKSPQKQNMQFWKHDNHAFYLYSNKMIAQKVDYIHYNPVKTGFVHYPHEWRMSSANPDGPIKVIDEIHRQYVKSKTRYW
jgi:putative transposase